MNKYNLTPIDINGPPQDTEYGTGTADLVNYGLRIGGTWAEYDLAVRLQNLRELMFTLVEQNIEEGNPVSDKVLQTLDVEIKVMTKKRLTL